MFPLRPGLKEPMTAHGVLDATCDPSQIIEWWTACPDANIGGATGQACGMWVLDIDGPAGRASLAAIEAMLGFPLPATMTTVTHKGEHRWFTMPDDGTDVRNSQSKIAPGIDVRGTGGYVVLPPSVHPDGGLYELIDQPVTTAPVGLLARPKLTVVPDPVERQQDIMDLLPRGDEEGGSDASRLAGMVRAAADRIRSAPKGTRNGTVNEACYSLGGWLDGLGGSVDDVAPELEAAAEAAEQSPRMVRRALEEGRARPRGRPPESVAPAALPPDLLRSPKPLGDISTWLDRLRIGVEAGDVTALLQDREVLLGLTRPSSVAGEVEVLMADLPHASRAALRRAGKKVSAAQRTETKARAATALPLVVEHGATWRVLDRDTYLVVDPRNVAAELQRLHQIETLIQTESSSRWMSPTEVYGAHGVTAKRVRWTYDAEGPSWDPTTRVLDVPGARVARGSAIRSEVVESWLSRFVAPAQLERFLDCLAVMPLLDRPTASGQYRGPDSAGKALLVAILTTWLGGRTDYAHATSEFNGGLAQGPLVVLDEGVAKSEPDAFRRLTGNREHMICNKGAMPEELIGCPRPIVTSNEPDALRLGREELSVMSEHAIGRRIIVFDVQDAAVDYLVEIGGWDATRDWADPEGPGVSHFRWLAETRKVTFGGRFMVEGDAADWVSKAHLRAGIAADVVRAFETYEDLIEESATSEISEPQAFFFDPALPTHIGMSVRGLQAHWQRLVGDSKVPSHQRLAVVLRRLSGQEKPSRLGPAAHRGPRYYLVPIALLKGGSG